jgi:anti-sigma B factor antagonist
MAIKTRDRDGVTVLEMTGNVRIGREDVELRDRFKALLDEGRRRFVIDMAAVGFIDSAGIAETIRCYKRVREAGGTIKLVLKEHGKPEEVFQITSLDRVFEVFYDQDQAVASFA